MKTSLVFLLAAALVVASCAAASLKGGAPKKRLSTLPRLTDNRIVGGETADISVYNYQISLRWKSLFSPKDPYRHVCGGSIYSKDLVITAAHCIIGDVPSQLQVVAGSSLINDVDGIVVPVQEIVMHRDYNPAVYDNDIALLVLGAPLPINNFTIGTIPLATQASRHGAMSEVTGWGTTVAGGGLPRELQAVQVPIVSNELCNEDYEDENITDAMLCAGYRGVGGKDACQGDSGGPLVVKGHLAGVVSWGYGCADPLYPGVYANVTHLLPWLLETIALYHQD